jgi:hypothetical protein
MLMDQDNDAVARNEVSLEVAEKLDKMQKQYMSATATGFMPNKPGSLSSSLVQPLSQEGGPPPAPAMEGGWTNNKSGGGAINN